MSLREVLNKALQEGHNQERENDMRLTAAQIMAQHPDKLKVLAQIGTAKGLREHPDWEAILLPGATPRQTLYDAINRTRTGKTKAGYPTGAVPVPKIDSIGRKVSTKMPKNVTVEQRNAIIRFIKDPANLAKYRFKKETFEAAVAAHAPGKLSSGSSAIYRWFEYIGKPGYDPDLSTGAVPTALATDIPQPVPSAPVAEPEAKRKVGHRMSKADTDRLVATLIINRAKFASFRECFIATVAELKMSLLPISANVSRYRKLAKASENTGNGAAVMIHTVQLLGRTYTTQELETILQQHQNNVRPIKHCPECGYSVTMHNKAYSIAIRHSHVEED